MAENYKHLYEQMKKMVAMYQDEIVPGMREQLENCVEVVRCKDCKHYKQNPWSNEENMMCMCWCDWLATDPDDFCSSGERKDNV